MTRLLRLPAMAGVVALITSLSPAAPRSQEYRLTRAYPNLSFTFPTDIQPANDGSGRIFVVEKRGVISVFYPDFNANQKSTFLDISAKVRSSGEAGLIGLAFHPNYKSNGFFYVFYVSIFPYRSIVARYSVTAGNPNSANPASELIMIDSPQSTVYHNGGQLAFGPDGHLYIGMGDAYTAETAQDLGDLAGSILRIDVDVPPPPGGSAAPRYEIPHDNPFTDNENGFREEIYAWGFRNPWRFCIDKKTGEMWVSDVGEDTWEEINLVERGKNYGWPLMEGPECFQDPGCNAQTDGLELPFYAYTHAEGVAVIGGYRYWGHRLPELAGYYLFADYTGGKIWGLRFDGAAGPERFDIVEDTPTVLTFGLTPYNEIVVGAADGYLYKLDRIVTGADEVPSTPSRLVGNFPNPFNPSTTLRYHLAERASVVMEIHGVDGALLERFELGARPAGDHELRWDGRTRNGRVASGVYFARLLVDGRAAGTTRMVLIQ